MVIGLLGISPPAWISELVLPGMGAATLTPRVDMKSEMPRLDCVNHV